MRSARAWSLAALLVLAPVAALVVLGIADPALTARLVDENGAVEWAQIVLGVVAAALALGRARALVRAGRSPAFDLVVGLALIVLAVAELELDRWIFGTKVIGLRFLLTPRKPVAWPWRMITNLIAYGIPVAVGAYAFTRARELFDAGRAALREAWGWILLAGVVVLGASQALESILARGRFVSPYFAEEVAELVASACFVVTYAARSPAPHRRSDRG